MTHDTVDNLLAVAAIAGIAGPCVSFVVIRYLGNLSDIRKELASHARQIRDTRAAVACCETASQIEHYPYTD